MDHQIVGRAEWQAARDKLLQREKEHTRKGDELAERLCEPPWVAIEKEYRFDAADGTRTLAELFDGRSQLLIYHFMFGPSYEAGCPVNSSMADGLDGLLPHLHARDVTLLLVSQAPLAKLQAYQREWAGASPGSRRRTPASTSTSARPSARSRSARGTWTKPAAADRGPERDRDRDGHPRIHVGVPGDERLHAPGRHRLPDLLRPPGAGSSS